MTAKSAEPVAIVMGSQSDWATMKHAAETLDVLGVAHESRIVSAHRTPERLYDFARGAKAEGFKVIIAGAGGAAHLPGMTASLTALPVFGVPVEIKALQGRISSLFHRADAGRHSGRHARHRQGGRHQCRRCLRPAFWRCRDKALAKRLEAWREKQTAAVAMNAQGRCLMRLATPLPPGSTIGILGGGQLGRMLALAAARLGFKCHIFAPEDDSPAFQVAAAHTVAGYDDFAALAAFARKVDVVTYEFENVPSETAAFLEPRVAACAKFRSARRSRRTGLTEKTFIAGLGIPVAPFAAVKSEAVARPRPSPGSAGPRS